MLCVIREEASRWPTNPYLRFLLLLLLTIALFAGAMSTGAWNCGNTNYKSEESGEETKYPGVEAYTEVVYVGERTRLTVRSTESGERRTIVWYPPAGATDVKVEGAQPEPGGPPFTFRNVKDTFSVSYAPPPLPEGQQQMEFTDGFEAHYSDGTVGTSAIETTVAIPWGSAQTIPSSPSADRPVSPAGQAEIDFWRIQASVDSASTELTTDLCNEWLTRLKGDDFFLAIRMPMASAAPTMSHRLPFVFGGPYSQTVSLREHTPGPPHLTVPLVYRLERLDFLGRELPAADGEHWAALGVSSEGPTTCPEGLQIPPGEWEIQADLLLDLHDQPDNCQGCMVHYYYCYEGQASPFEEAVSAMADVAAVQSYQTEGITCFGPKTIPLMPSGSSLYLGGVDSARIMPPQHSELRETLQNETDSALTVELDYASTIAGWEVYGGTWEEPDLGEPIAKGSEIVLGTSFPSNRQMLWLINDVVECTPDGAHSLVISATVPAQPDLSTSDNIPIWCGEWVAPPAAPCTTLDGVSIDGAAVGPTGSYTFTSRAAPPTATRPITYTWQADGQTPETHRNRGTEDTMSFTWNVAGSQAVTVTAANACGVEVSATHTIEVEPPCEPLASLSLAGPTTTTVDLPAAFIATAGPLTVTKPITYTWQATDKSDEIHVGQGITDTVSFAWAISGTKTVTVTATNACSELGSERLHVTVEKVPEENQHIYLPLVLRRLHKGGDLGVSTHSTELSGMPRCRHGRPTFFWR